MSAVEKVLEEEAEALERKLEATPDFRRLRVIRQTLSDLAALNGPRPTHQPPETPEPSAPLEVTTHQLETVEPVAAPARRFRQATSIGQAVRFALEDANMPLSTRRLMELLPFYGRTVGGKHPAWNLSNALSSDGRYASVPWEDAKAWWFSGRPLPE